MENISAQSFIEPNATVVWNGEKNASHCRSGKYMPPYFYSTSDMVVFNWLTAHFCSSYIFTR